MIFLKPEYLYLMLPPTILLFYLMITKKDPLEGYFDPKILEKLRFDNDALGRMGRNLLLFASLVMMIVALARPVIAQKDIQTKQRRINLLIALDISDSMRARDRYPDRLQFAKKRINALIDALPEADIALIAFGSGAYLVSPLSEDQSSVKYLLENLSTQSLSAKGTDVMLALQKGDEVLPKGVHRNLLLVTDGGEERDFSEQIAYAKDHNETIFIYGIGSQKGAPIYKEGNKAVRDKAGNIVITRLNRAIETLAVQTGGAFIQAHYKDHSVDLLSREIRNKADYHLQQKKALKHYKELFYYPLGLALLLMLFVFHSIPKRKALVWVLILVGVGQGDLKASNLSFVEKYRAQKAYESGDYKEALRHFQALALALKSDASFYDLANAYYKIGKYKKAIKIYNDIHSDKPMLVYKKYFNIGNCYFRLGNYEKALEAYLQAQKFHNEPDLEHNIELTKKRLKKQKKQSKQEKKPKNKKKQKQKQESQNSSKQKQKKRQKKPAKPKKSQKSLSPKEKRLWENYLKKSRPKTKPIELKRTDKRREDEHPW